MFNRQEKGMKDPIPQATPQPVERRPAAAEPMDQKLNSIMGRGSKVNGEIKADGSIRIDGDFEGTVESGDTLVVGKDGSVRANVKVKRAVIGGRFEGNVHASVKVELHSGCEMLGDVVTPSLVIEEGVVFEGNCKMGKKSSTSTASQTASSGGESRSAQPVGAAGGYERKG